MALLVFFAGLLAVVAAALAVAGMRPSRWGQSLLQRGEVERAPVPASLGVLVAGSAATLVISYLLGKLAGALEGPVDIPVFRWSQQHVIDWWYHANGVLTQMGNRPVVQLVAVVSGIVLALAWRRRWWLPLCAIAAAYLLERYGQELLAVTVDRGHPPTTHGTYPSGGCARLVGIYGVILFLSLAIAPRLSRRVRVLAWSALAVLAYVEGYTRMYLLKHWVTDVVGGWAFGALILAVVVAATLTLLRGLDGRLESAPGDSGATIDVSR